MKTKVSMMKEGKFAWILALGMALVAAGCLSGPSPSPGTSIPSGSAGSSSDTAQVEMKNIQFVPATLTVGVGTTVTWTNHDSVSHTVTPTDRVLWGSEGSGDDPSRWLKPGESWSFTFTKAGTYKYYCIPHAARGDDGEWRGMVGTIVVTEGESGGSLPSITVVPSPLAPERKLPDPDGVVRFTLETREVRAQLSDTSAYEFWTFGGTVPGPMLRVREGDVVEITIRNPPESRHSHSIDLHAVTGPGGGAKATQTPPGSSTAFWFKALHPGLYVYHCATPHVPTHIASGMYGLILVEPREGLPPVDREFYVVQGEIYTRETLGSQGFLTFSLDKLLEERPEYFLFNGRVGALGGKGALKAHVNETVRIFFGVGGFVPSSFHVIGEIFDTVWPEGGTPAIHDVQTTLVPAGGAAIVEFRVEVPGTFLLVDHTLTHSIDRGAVGELVVEGAQNPAVFAPQ